MIYLIIITMGLTGRAYGEQTEQCEITEDHSVLALCPLMSSPYMIASREKHTESHVIALVQLIKVLQWKQIIIVHDDAHSDVLQLIRPTLGLASVYDLSKFQHSRKMRELLKQLNKKFFPRLQLLLLSSHSRALEVLRIVNRIDLESNRTTDFRHHSFWVVACYNLCETNTSGLLNLQQLENVILLSSQRDGCSVPYQQGEQSFSAGKDTEAMMGKQDVFPNTRYGFNNRTLIVSTIVDEPHVIMKGKRFKGYLIEFLDCLAAVLNFSYVIVHPQGMQWGKKIDGRWDGLVGQLERREVDLVVAALTIHEDREKVMDFLYPPVFTGQDDIMYQLHFEDTGSWQIYLKLFSSLVLLLLFAALLISTVMGYILFRFEDTIPESHSHSGSGRRTWKYKMYNIADRFIYMFGILILRGLESNPRYQSTRLLLFTWGIFSVIIATCYSAHLVAIFAVQKQTLPFTSLGELVRQKEYKWGLPSGEVRELIFEGARNADMKLAWEGVVKFNKTDPDVLSRDLSTHINKVKTEKYAMILHRDRIERERGYDCNIRHVGQDIIWHQFGIGVPTDYPLKREIENILTTIMDSGLPDIWWRRWNNYKVKECAEDKTVNTLTLSDVASIFYVLCVGLGASAITLMIEFIIHKQHSKH